MNYTTQQLSEISGAHLIGESHLQVQTLEFDTRNIYTVENTAFLAISTKKNSGQKYISSAIEKGIRIIICENEPQETAGITWIIVENAISFLQKIAAYHIQQYSLKTIGITGSNGKTIVKEWLYQSIQNNYKTVKSPKSFNSQIGLPLSLLETSAEDEVGIFEVGISQPDEMEKLAAIFSPEIGVLTHIGTAHSANFQSEKQLIEEKILLFKDSKTIIFNGDHHLVNTELTKKYRDRKLISYGFKPENTLHISSDIQDEKTDIEISMNGETWSFPAKQRDEATLSNALCIIAILKELGFENHTIIQKINQLKSVEMRLESVDGIRNNLLVNDSYNLDLDSLKIAFQFIKQYNKPKKSLVLTDFLESKDSDLLYHQAAEMTNLQEFEKVFLIGEEITLYQNEFRAETYTFKNTEALLQSGSLNQIENELILLKGARKFEIEKIKSFLELQKHDTVLEVNLNAILHNINIHKALLKPETKMMAMVKAYSYGLGGYEIAEFLQHHHIDYLGVAYADEGIDLRKHGISTPIMVMNPEQHSYPSIIAYNLEPEIYSLRVLNLFNENLHEHGVQRRFPIHIKIETGMNRLGFRYEEIDELLHQLENMNVEVKSVFTHLSSADDEAEQDFTLQQIAKFERAYNHLAAGLKYQPIRHVLNSTGIANYTDYQFEMVRIGIGMVGISYNKKLKKQLRSAVSFKTVISQISHVKQNESIGYNRKHRMAKDSFIATIPVGYADGIRRSIGNGKGKIGIHGKLFPIVGNICMDMMMIDLGNENMQEGDEITIFNSHPSLEEFSSYCETIPYEVLTSISRRVKRIYIKD